jgi:hypothetical protein
MDAIACFLLVARLNTLEAKGSGRQRTGTILFWVTMLVHLFLHSSPEVPTLMLPVKLMRGIESI